MPSHSSTGATRNKKKKPSGFKSRIPHPRGAKPDTSSQKRKYYSETRKNKNGQFKKLNGEARKEHGEAKNLQKLRERKLDQWEAFVQDRTIAVAGVTVESLRSIGKGAKAKKTAEKLMKKFIEDTVPAISTSGIWTEDPSLLPPGTVPKTLIAYFADGDGLDAQGQQITFGVNSTAREMAHYALQACFSNAPPPLETKGDGRHNTTKSDAHTLHYETVDGEDGFEDCGNAHYVLWTMHRHPDGPLYISRDIAKSSTNSAHYNTYVQYQTDLVNFLEAAVAEYKTLKTSWDRGHWVGCHGPPFLGQAIVWKYQVNLHKDPNDWEICVTTPSGYYEGGEALFPDLNLKLSYRPGHVLVFRSPILWHAIAPWTPSVMEHTHQVTPGCISWVFFSRKETVQRTLTWPPGYGIDTAFGALTSLVDSFPALDPQGALNVDPGDSLIELMGKRVVLKEVDDDLVPTMEINGETVVLKAVDGELVPSTVLKEYVNHDKGHNLDFDGYDSELTELSDTIP